MFNEKNTAYKRGIDAAYRIGEYEGYTITPECPYKNQSKEYDEWLDGFGDGTEDYINMRYL